MEEKHSGCVTGRGMARAVEQALERLRRGRRSLIRWAEGRQEVPAAAQWLLDNGYLAQREGRQAARELRYAKGLRRTKQGVYLYRLAGELAARTGELTAEKIAAFLTERRREPPLTEEELACFVPALKGALILRLAGVCGAWEGQEGELARIFGGLRMLAQTDLSGVLEKASAVEQALRRDPAGVYPQMDDETRGYYRRQMCALARRYGMTQEQAASRVLELCRAATGEERHVGWFLFRRPMGRPCPAPAAGRYMGRIAALTLALTLLAGGVLRSPAAAVLLLIPLSDLAKRVVDAWTLRRTSPRPVHRLALDGGIPDGGRTLCVIAGLLTGPEAGAEYAALLERYRLANRDAGGKPPVRPAGRPARQRQPHGGAGGGVAARRLHRHGGSESEIRRRLSPVFPPSYVE